MEPREQTDNNAGRTAARKIFLVFLRLGLTSFGGPTAHLAYFREAFVERRRWLSDAEYADLVALCQFLPGPGSSQMGLAIGLRRGGWPGAAAAWLGFTLPSAVLMVLFGLSLTRWSDPEGSGWLHGLQLAAVVVIAKAVWSMAATLCPDRARATMALAAAAVVLAWPGTLAQLGVIAVGALLGWSFLKPASADAAAKMKSADPVETTPSHASGWISSMVCLTLLALLFFGLPVAAQLFDSHLLRVVDGFFRTGSLVFGGGHVVLPLLRAEMVEPGYLTEDAFMAGYGAAQAVPGPLFTFAGFCGAVMEGETSPLLMATLCLLAVFAPSVLLIGGLMPMWERLRGAAGLQKALAGTNAAVVGLLGAALYRPAWTGSVTGVGDVIFLLGVAALLMVWKQPAWLVVIVAALGGAWLL